jgi:ribosomal protein S18 acetylase RimI-like enzyme
MFAVVMPVLTWSVWKTHLMSHLTPAPGVFRMRIELGAAARRDPVWPDSVRVRTFRTEDAKALHSLLVHCYRRGGGSVAAFERWLPDMTTDEEFDPELWFLAESDGVLIGAVLCWTSAFIKDVVVHESWRGRGVGEALLLHALGTFARRGATTVELKVESTNAPAIRLYERLGMRIVERLDSS